MTGLNSLTDYLVNFDIFKPLKAMLHLRQCLEHNLLQIGDYLVLQGRVTRYISQQFSEHAFTHYMKRDRGVRGSTDLLVCVKVTKAE